MTIQNPCRGSGVAPTVPVTPLGIHTRWKNDAVLLKLIRSKAAVPVDANSPANLRFTNLQAYANGGNPFTDAVDPTQPRRGPLAALVADALWGDPEVIERWALPMLLGQPTSSWLPDFAHDASYAHWRWRIQCLVHGNDGRVFLEVPASVLARCLFLGWMEEARWVADSIRQVYAKRLLANVSGKVSQPLNHFLLRVAFDYWEMSFDGWGKGHNPRLDPKLDPKDVFRKNECFGEPVLNVLYEHWRDADLSAFADHLVWAADFTTYRLNTDCEFAWGGPLAARMPGILLPFARLRSCLGLEMPAIPHPLLAAPHSKLPEPCSRYTDPLLERVLDRLKQEELPELQAL